MAQEKSGVKAKYTAIDIANIFIDMAVSFPNDSIDSLKLNKLCYYAQGWSLAKLGYPLFDDRIEAWAYGPVIPDVYQTYKGYKDSPIENPTYFFNEERLSSDELSLLVDVYNTYGKYTSVGLVSKTHEVGSPWRRVYQERENNEITKGAMEEYFSKSDELEVFTLNTAKENVISYV